MLSLLASALPAILAIVSGSFLLIFTVLREMQLFWRNAGGYPFWLRDLVLNGFHPLLIFCFGSLVCAVWKLLTHRTRSPRSVFAQSAMVLMGTLLLTMSLTMAVTNNVINLIEGRPLHSH